MGRRRFSSGWKLSRNLFDSIYEGFKTCSVSSLANFLANELFDEVCEAYVYEISLVRAKQKHECRYCGRMIRKNTKYVRVVFTRDYERFYSFAVCMKCYRERVKQLLSKLEKLLTLK